MKKDAWPGLEARVERLRAEQKSGQVHLCFGSKKLFRAQFHLEENGFQSHEEWKQAWSEARSRQFFIIGSHDETAGFDHHGFAGTSGPVDRCFGHIAEKVPCAT
jgi:hypothetical protein